MSEEKKDLLDKIKTMSLEELQSYYKIMRAINTILNIFGISMILLMLIFTNIVSVICGGMLTMWAAMAGAAAGNLKTFVRHQMLKFDK